MDLWHLRLRRGARRGLLGGSARTTVEVTIKQSISDEVLEMSLQLLSFNVVSKKTLRSYAGKCARVASLI